MEIKAVTSKLTGTSINHEVKRNNTSMSSANLSFKGAGANTNKLSNWTVFYFKKLANVMKSADEVINAIIQAIGTGIIAPLIILVSPGKGDKEDKDKKGFQALRQPLSAIFALSFQLPATIAVNRFFDKRAFVDKSEFFRDDEFGDLIPTQKYLKRVTSKEELAEMAEKFDKVTDGKKSDLYEELKNRIIEEYKESGLTVSDERLEKDIVKQKKEFLLDKIADQKREGYIVDKIKGLSDAEKEQIKISQLVTEEYKALGDAKADLFKDEFKELENNVRNKKANLSLWDKTLDLLGFSNSKLKAVSDAKDELATARACKILESEKIMENDSAKLKKYILNRLEEANKRFANKKYWLSMVVNLFMLTASCYALNWAHPRVKLLWDKHKGNIPEESQDKKVEVKA